MILLIKILIKAIQAYKNEYLILIDGNPLTLDVTLRFIMVLIVKEVS